MKKRKTGILAAVCFAAVFFMLSCQQSVNGSGSSGSEQHKVTTKQILKFNQGSAKALAVVDDENNGARAARSAATEMMIAKIMDDGTLESFMDVPGGFQMSPVKFIAQSPEEDAREVYIIFEDRSWGWVENENIEIGQLLCVYEDGTYEDILQSDDGTWKWLYTNNNEGDPIVFDKSGGMYYLVQESSGNSWTNMIYKYDNKTNTSTKLTQAIENTYYEKFQVSDDGKWIFAKANRWNGTSSVSYLRAIPVDDPSNFKDLFYSSGNGGWINDWIYYNDCLYYNLSGTMYKIPKVNDSYDKANREVLFSGNSNSWFQYDYIFDWSNSSGSYDYKAYNSVYNKYYYFRNPYSEEQEIQNDEILNYLFAKATYNLADGSSYWKSDDTSSLGDAYDIRFDIFSEVPGFEILASATKGLKNKEALDAISDNNLQSLFKTLLDGDACERYSRSNAGYYDFYDHNFFADILYVKDTDTLIPEKEISHSGFNPGKFSSRGLYYYDLLDWSYSSSSNYIWKKEFQNSSSETQAVDAEKVLAELATYCKTKKIDFKLTAFKDIPGYTSLYSELINEEAIEFLDNPTRISLLVRYMNEIYDSSNGHGKFLSLTCFVKDTDESAYDFKTETAASIWWGNVSHLTPSYGKSLFGTYDNGLVEILDETGNRSGKYVDCMSGFAVVHTVVSENGFYFQNAILDSEKEETGKHQIQYYSVKDKKVENLFTNVQDAMEVISFSVGGDYVYYSGAVGFDFVNGKINTTTLEASEWRSEQKLSQIISIR